jgi:hypothetical protein
MTCEGACARAPSKSRDAAVMDDGDDDDRCVGGGGDGGGALSLLAVLPEDEKSVAQSVGL